MENKISQTDPKALMRLAKEGDTDAFVKIYEVYFVPVFRYIYFRVKDRQDAEDLTQTVFLKVYQAISRIEEQNRSPLAYFFTVARNTVIDYWRKKKAILLENPEKEIIESPQAAEVPEDIIQKNEIADMLQQAIQELTKEQQSVIIFKFINDLPNKEISKIIQRSEEAVRQLQCRAIKALRQYFKKHE